MRFSAVAVVAWAVVGTGAGWCEAAKPAQDRLLGDWVPVEATDGGYARLKVSKDGAEWAVEGWVTLGLGRPVEAHAGKFRLHLLGDRATDKELPYGLAEREETFAKTYLTLRIEKDQLVVERYTIITDGSARSSYRVAQTFKRN
jgi:hypothetical protein